MISGPCYFRTTQESDQSLASFAGSSYAMIFATCTNYADCRYMRPLASMAHSGGFGRVRAGAPSQTAPSQAAHYGGHVWEPRERNEGRHVSRVLLLRLQR